MKPFMAQIRPPQPTGAVLPGATMWQATGVGGTHPPDFGQPMGL